MKIQLLSVSFIVALTAFNIFGASASEDRSEEMNVLLQELDKRNFEVTSVSHSSRSPLTIAQAFLKKNNHIFDAIRSYGLYSCSLKKADGTLIKQFNGKPCERCFQIITSPPQEGIALFDALLASK